MKAELSALVMATPTITFRAAERVDWGKRQIGANLPALIFHGVDTAPDYAMSGASGLVDDFITAECWGATYKDADDLVKAVKALLSGYRDTASGFHGIFVEGQRDGSEYAAPTQFFCISLDLRVWHVLA